MHKETITYTDFNGVQRTETHYFHLNEVELSEMEMSYDGGFVARVQSIIDAQERTELLTIFKKLVLDSYGIKRDEGRRFEKSPEISKAFEQTGAFVKLYMKLATDAKAASAFINGIIPAGMREASAEQAANVMSMNAIAAPVEIN